MASINDLATAASAVSALKPGSSVLAGASRSSVPQSDGEIGSAGVRGALIILEGLDRSGKTTQVKLLEQRFVELGRKVKLMRFPDRTTPIGQMIDGYLRSQIEMDDHVVHLLFSANRWEAAKTITSLLASGTTVLCDRYYYSGVVYSAAKNNPALSLTWARNPEVGLPRPDLVVFLDLDEDHARARGGWGGELYEKAEMQRRVRELFRGLSRGVIGSATPSKDEEMGGSTSGAAEIPPIEKLSFKQEQEDLCVVDASSSVEDVAEAIWTVVMPKVEEVASGAFGSRVRIVS